MFLAAILDRETYEQMRNSVDGELAEAELSLSRARMDEIEVEKVLDFAENLLLNPALAWQRCSLSKSSVCSRSFSQKACCTKTEFIELKKPASCSRA